MSSCAAQSRQPAADSEHRGPVHAGLIKAVHARPGPPSPIRPPLFCYSANSAWAAALLAPCCLRLCAPSISFCTQTVCLHMRPSSHVMCIPSATCALCAAQGTAMWAKMRHVLGYCCACWLCSAVCIASSAVSDLLVCLCSAGLSSLRWLPLPPSMRICLHTACSAEAIAMCPLHSLVWCNALHESASCLLRRQRTPISGVCLAGAAAPPVCRAARAFVEQCLCVCTVRCMCA